MYGMVKSLKDYYVNWRDARYERKRVRQLSQYASEIERQIREQLQQHHEQHVRSAVADGFREGVDRACTAYMAEYDLLRGTVATQEAKIRELESKQSLTKGNPRIRTKSKKRAPKR